MLQRCLGTATPRTDLTKITNALNAILPQGVYATETMNKKTFILIGVAALLAAVYVTYFTDWIQTPTIQIICQVRPSLGPRDSNATFPVLFTLDDKYLLTSVKVIPVAALATNRNPLPLWHLIRFTNAPPLKGFMYGAPITGMRSSVPKARAQPLQPHVTYRLLIASGRAKGQLDFQAAAPPAR